jgi:hypothetical protein
MENHYRRGNSGKRRCFSQVELPSRQRMGISFPYRLSCPTFSSVCCHLLVKRFFTALTISGTEGMQRRNSGRSSRSCLVSQKQLNPPKSSCSLTLLCAFCSRTIEFLLCQSEHNGYLRLYRT